MSEKTNVDDIIRTVHSKAMGRTRYEGQRPFWDEMLVGEIESLRSRLAAAESENATLSAELAKAREACEQGKARCQNFLNGLLPACGPMTSATAVMISSIQNDFKEALGHDFEAEAKALAAKGATNE